MTRLEPTLTEARKFLKVMDPEAKLLRGTPEAAAAEALAIDLLSAAWGMYEDVARYVVVGQLRRGPDGPVAPGSPEWEQVAFGPYRSGRKGPEAAVSTAIDQLQYSSATGESMRTATVEFVHGTPASWFGERKRERNAALTQVNDDVTIDSLESGAYIEHYVASKGGKTVDSYYDEIRCLDQVSTGSISTRCVKSRGHAGECQASWPPLPRCPIEVLDEESFEFAQCNRPKGHKGDHDPYSKSLFRVDGVNVKGDSDG